MEIPDADQLGYPLWRRPRAGCSSATPAPLEHRSRSGGAPLWRPTGRHCGAARSDRRAPHRDERIADRSSNPGLNASSARPFPRADCCNAVDHLYLRHSSKSFPVWQALNAANPLHRTRRTCRKPKHRMCAPRKRLHPLFVEGATCAILRCVENTTRG